MNKFDKFKPVGTYVFNRRGRFSVIGTVIVLYPWLRRPRPRHTWMEFEKDFRMYDQVHARKGKSKTKK